jgi:uncharacterized Tic20 family protein
VETRDQRIAAALAHSLIAANWMGMAGAAVVWLTERERSEEVGFQALQALVFQFLGLILTLLGVGAYMVALGIVMVIGFALGDEGGMLIGLVSILGIPAIMAVPSAFLFYGIFGAYVCLQGKSFEYVLIGPVLRRFLSGKGAVP